jgi:hypothetical protein
LKQNTSPDIKKLKFSELSWRMESIQNVTDFQGENYQKSDVPEVAQKVLRHWDPEANHYEVVETRLY